MIAGRAIERLGQFYEGLPVFGGQVVRQMDGRAIVSVTGRLYESLDVDVNPSISPERAQRDCRGRGRRRRQHPRRDDARHPARRERIPPRLSHDGPERLGDSRRLRRCRFRRDRALSINGIHTQAAIGQGNGIFGTLRKMSTNQTSSTYQAVDKLRPAEAFTLAFPGTPARLNFFLQTLVALQFGRGDRQRQRVDRRPDGGCARVSGMGVRLLLQAVRPARHGRSRHRGRQHRAPALAFGGQSAAAGCRRHVHQQRVLLLRRPARVRRRRRTPLQFSRRRLRRRRARMDARRHRLHARSSSIATSRAR